MLYIKNGVSFLSRYDLVAFSAAKNITRSFVNDLPDEATADHYKHKAKPLVKLKKTRVCQKESEKAKEAI